MKIIATLIIAALTMGGFSVSLRPRLLVLGDSLTRGLYATQETNGFKHHLAERLGADLESASGFNLQGLIDLWHSKEWQADVIVIEIGLNDLCTDCAWYMTDAEWAEKYGELLDAIQADTDAEIIACTMFWGGYIVWSEQYEPMQRRNDLIKRQAAIRGITVADLYTSTEDCLECVSTPDQFSPFAPDFHGDNFHPSDLGHRVIAETIYKALRSEVFIPLVVR